MCWDKVSAFVFSNNLQSNDVVHVPTSKSAQFIYSALKSSTIRILPLLYQDLSFLRRKSSTTHSGLRCTTSNLISRRLHFSLQRTSSHVLGLCASVLTVNMVKVLFVYRIIPPPPRFGLSVLLDKKPTNRISSSNASYVSHVSETATTSGFSISTIVLSSAISFNGLRAFVQLTFNFVENFLLHPEWFEDRSAPNFYNFHRFSGAHLFLLLSIVSQYGQPD